MTSDKAASGVASQLILVVEDEERLARIILDYLEAAGFRTHWNALGEDAVAAARKMEPSLILLDLNLPDIDGLLVCRHIREFTTTPIIMLTARTEEIDRVLGLDAGADDYICKPFDLNELLARIRANLRRMQWPAGKPPISGLVLDESRHAATLDGEPLDLTPVEFNLLNVLLKAPGRVFSRSQLLDLVYDDARDVTDRTIDSHVKNLRIKFRHCRAGVELIHSIYGVGYKFEP